MVVFYEVTNMSKKLHFVGVMKEHDLSKYTVPTSFVGIAVPTKVVGMLVVSALPTKVVQHL